MPDWKRKLLAVTQETLAAERPSGQFFGTKSGVLTFNKIPVPQNTMEVAITGYAYENAYYPDAYDAENIVPPTCYAFGIGTDAGMKPHEESHIKQSPDCASCPHAKFGSSTTGTRKGKACRNLRRLCVIPEHAAASAEGIKKAPAGFVRLAVYSGMAWGDYVRRLAIEQKSPYTVITRMKLIPDVKAQFKFQFEFVRDIEGDDVMEAIMARHDFDISDMCEPYPSFDAEEPAALPNPAPAGKAAKRKF